MQKLSIITTHLLGIFIQGGVIVETLELPFRVGKLISVVRIPRGVGDLECVVLVLDENSNACRSAKLKDRVRVYASDILFVE